MIKRSLRSQLINKGSFIFVTLLVVILGGCLPKKTNQKAAPVSAEGTGDVIGDAGGTNPTENPSGGNQTQPVNETPPAAAFTLKDVQEKVPLGSGQVVARLDIVNPTGVSTLKVKTIQGSCVFSAEEGHDTTGRASSFQIKVKSTVEETCKGEFFLTIPTQSVQEKFNLAVEIKAVLAPTEPGTGTGTGTVMIEYPSQGDCSLSLSSIPGYANMLCQILFRGNGTYEITMSGASFNALSTVNSISLTLNGSSSRQIFFTGKMDDSKTITFKAFKSGQQAGSASFSYAIKN